MFVSRIKYKIEWYYILKWHTDYNDRYSKSLTQMKRGQIK